MKSWFVGNFWINPPDGGGGHGLKIIGSKNRHHFEKPTFLVLQLCSSYLFWFGHFKCLKNARCLWFGRFSSREKRCTHAGLKRKVVVLKKLVFQSGVGFLIRWFLDHGLCHLVDFKGERDPLQQNGVQGQNQFWLIVSKICCNFLVEFVSSFFSLKWRVWLEL